MDRVHVNTNKIQVVLLLLFRQDNSIFSFLKMKFDRLIEPSEARTFICFEPIHEVVSIPHAAFYLRFTYILFTF